MIWRWFLIVCLFYWLKISKSGLTFRGLVVWIECDMASHPSINRESFVGENHLRCLLQKLLLNTFTFSFLTGPPCYPLFSSSDRGRKRRGRSRMRSNDQDLSSRESGWCIILVAVKELLRRISCGDRVSPSEGMYITDRWALILPKLREADFSLVAGVSLFSSDTSLGWLWGAEAIPSSSCMSYMLRSLEDCWGPFSSFSQREEDIGVNLVALDSWGNRKGECVSGWHTLSVPSCLGFSVFTFGCGMDKGAKSFGRCSSVTLSVFLEFGREAELVGWLERVDSDLMYFFKNIDTEI